jgi:hypothetical protein
MARLPIRCIWIATGNNPEFSNEMARRLVRIRLDAHVERPWQRAGFRHPDLMIWVRANRVRLVAACLTICQAWLAAGRPRGARTIGSYENWAQVLGGVLDVAGVEGFLGNLDEMLEASDGEGAVWRSFVSAWWDRFGTAEVGTNDLYETALSCEPPLPLGSGNDRSQRTRLGKALGRLRDRIFQFDGRCLRIEALGVSHKVQRWRLAFDEKIGADERTPRPPSGASPGDVVTLGGTLPDNLPLENYQTNQDVGVRGGRGVRFSNPYTCAGTRTRVKEDAGKRPPPPPRPPSACEHAIGDGGLAGGRLSGCPHISNPPDWLKEVL